MNRVAVDEAASTKDSSSYVGRVTDALAWTRSCQAGIVTDATTSTSPLRMKPLPRPM